MISEFQWFSAYASQSEQKLSFRHLNTAFEEDPIAYAVYCSYHNIKPIVPFSPYELDAISFYREKIFIPNGLWVDRTLEYPSFSSQKYISQKNQLLERMIGHTDQILRDQIALRPVVFTSAQIQIVCQSDKTLAADSFYHKFFTDVQERPIQYWMDRNYHKTFDRALHTQNLKNLNLQQDLWAKAVSKGSLPLIESLVRAFRSSIPLDSNLLHLAIASEEPAMVQCIIDLGITPTRLHLLNALDSSAAVLPVLLKNSPFDLIDSLRGDLLLKAPAEELTYLQSPNKKIRLSLF